MIKLRRYIPDFVETDEEALDVEVETLDEMFALPFIKRFKEIPEFMQFSQSCRQLSYRTLLAEYRDGKEWWVVAFLYDKVDGLPEWSGGIYECEQGDFPGSMVSSSCGDEVRLKDGRILTRKSR
jgi:hypothetical protein